MRTLGLLVTLLCLSLSRSDSPSLVVEIFRHGIRSPEATQYDPSWANVGYGELTNFGMRQQYILGAALGDTYPDLLLPYNPAKIYVQTTQENRTITSALSQLYGIYEGHGPNLPDNFNVTIAIPPYDNPDVAEVVANLTGVDAAVPGNYFPLPIHSIQRSADILMESYLNCPNANQYFNQHQNDSTVAAVYAELSSTIQAVNAAGLEVSDYSDLDDLGDTVMANYPNQVSLPGGIVPLSQEYYDLVFWTQWYEIYPVLALPIQRQWFSGPFLYNLLGMFQQVQNDTTSLNFVFYAAKETMLATILTALNIMTPECLRENWENQRAGQNITNPQCRYPNFAANLIFEFYNTTAPYIIVKYNGDIVNLCNGQQTCSLNDFANLVQTVTNGTDLPTFNQNCGIAAVKQNPTNPMPSPGDLPFKLDTLDIVLLCIILALVVSLVVVLLRARKYKKLGTDFYKSAEVDV